MKVVILCGGAGTRLREETEFRPKPMVEIGGRPILWHLMKIYSQYGFSDFVLCLGYKGEVIKQYFLNFQAFDSDFIIHLGHSSPAKFYRNKHEENWTVTLADSGLTTLTGARVKRIEKYVDGDDFMLTYGDGLAAIDLMRLLQFHREHGKIGTVTGVQPPSRFGKLRLEGNAVAEFCEKPLESQGYVSGGFFVFKRRFFDYLSADDQCVLEREPLERLAEDGQLMMYPHDGFWHCMDTYRDFQYLNELWQRENCPWKIW